MRRSALLVSLLLAGCGGAGETAGTRPAAPEPQPPRKGAWRSIPWDLIEVQGRDVIVSYQDGGCVAEGGDVLVRGVAAESDDVVSVAVFVSSGNPCAGVGITGTAVARLARPLGERRLVHAEAHE